ncbi:CDC16 protein [Coemansia sp. IMI 203386]|nr:CDC16 protein [Coemansia sp. IMI 203386]
MQPSDKQQQQQRKDSTSSTTRTRGLTPRMIELSRRLNEIEFQDNHREPSSPNTRTLGLLGKPVSPAAAPHLSRSISPPRSERFYRKSPPLSPQITKHSHRTASPLRQQTDNIVNRARLRDRMRVPVSEPSRLDGLELVEPAKVDTLYVEDVETYEYRERRRMRESIGSNEGFSMDLGLPRRSFSGNNSPTKVVSEWEVEIRQQRQRRLREYEKQESDERRKLVSLTRRIHEDWNEVSSSMRDLRVLIACNGGLPVGSIQKMRGRLWLAMLEVRDIGIAGYVRALRMCPSSSADKINNDAFRTLRGDTEFRSRVTTESLVRVLNAILSAPDKSAADPPRYVQGMNTLLAPFLYVMGENAGFYAYRQFLRKECPLYARPSLPGVHACVQLVDECLAFVDGALYSHLKRHGAVAKIYAFPAAMTLCANIGPLRQVVFLWDFLLAFGVHLNVVCIVAQLLSMRELLVTTNAPMAFLRSWPPLRAESVIRRTREIYETLPDSLRRRIKYHAHDPSLAEDLAGAPQVRDPLSTPSPRQQEFKVEWEDSVDNRKRDLPLSPPMGQRNSSMGDEPEMSQRPRARTFSGMVKRLRTVPVTAPNDLMPTIMRANRMDDNNRLASPRYGDMGLGLRAALTPRATSGGSVASSSGGSADWIRGRRAGEHGR